MIMTNRRNFLKSSAMIASSSLFVPHFLSASEKNTGADYKGKKLVVVQLDGGNDGLNTIIPYTNDIYYQLRPNIAVHPGQVIPITDELGLNAGMKAMQTLYDNGELAIINNVGYPNPDRSHFRSMDIWHSASDSDVYLKTGWLGRMLDTCCPHDAGQYFGLEAGVMLSLALKGDRMKGMAVEDIDRLYRTARDPFLSNVATVHHSDGDSVDYLYKTLIDTRKSAAYLKEKADLQKTSGEYPQNTLAYDLKGIAQLINAGAETKVYFTSISGFDTHANQLPRQNKLLEVVSDSLFAFVSDLRNGGQLGSTLILVFSEFGRRVNENGSRGTDHGTANNVWLIGGNLKKAGFLNEGTNLEHLKENDLIFSVDFRSIYATILDNFLDVSSKVVLGRGYNDLGFV
jgi:uncharacterized protein (DUF1501 family)